MKQTVMTESGKGKTFQGHPFKVVANNVVVFHHAYIGALLLGWQFSINVVGILILLDDIYEHVVDYNSPLRIFFDRYISPRLFGDG